MALDQGERLENRVVDASCDLVSLLASNTRCSLCVAIDREAPEPRACNEEQRARNGARRQHRLVDPSAGENEHRPGGRECYTERGERRVSCEGSSAAPDQRQPSCRESDSDHDTIVESERVEDSRDSEQAEDRNDPDAAGVAVGPERQIEQDARATGKREDREDEPDQGRIDAEGLRDARADPRDDPIVGTTGAGAKCH